MKIDGWHIRRNTDRFTGAVYCVLSGDKGRIRYWPGAVGLSFSRHSDTIHAWYRVDGGVPIRWQDRLPGLVAAGVPLDSGRLDSPMEGVLWVPSADLGSAHYVWVRLDPRRSARRFAVANLAQAISTARAFGCPDAAFTR